MECCRGWQVGELKPGLWIKESFLEEGALTGGVEGRGGILVDCQQGEGLPCPCLEGLSPSWEYVETPFRARRQVDQAPGRREHRWAASPSLTDSGEGTEQGLGLQGSASPVGGRADTGGFGMFQKRNSMSRSSEAK